MKKVLLIYNIHSGKGMIKSKLAGIINEFNKKDFLVHAIATQYRCHATELVKQLGREYPLIVCSGGDGTLSEVLDGIMEIEEENRPKIGYIPAGSTNDFAATLKLPFKMKECAQMITNEYYKKVDVGRFLNDYFVYVAAFGAFTEVSYNTPQEEKNLWGHQAYIWEGMRQISSIRSYYMKIALDDQVIEGRFIYGMVYNANSVGGFKNMTQNPVVLDDGLLDVLLVVAPENMVEWPIMLTELLTKKSESKFVVAYRASHISFVSDECVDWVLDGEFGGSHEKVVIDTYKQAMEIAVNEEE